MIKANFDANMIKQRIREFSENSMRVVLNNYKYVGETFVRNARLKNPNQGGFHDITGNLRSSIGYILLKDGIRVEELFEEGQAGSDKSTGVNKAKNFADEIAQKFPQGIVLIVFAGMQYAASVESRGRDVITGTSLDIEGQLQSLFSAL